LLLSGLVGCGSPSFLVTPVYPQAQLRETVVEQAPDDARGPGGKIAIVELEGVIMNATSGGLLQSQENPVNRFVEALGRAEKDKNVKAVVIRINSPGGSVAGSETLFNEVQRFRKRTGKPVIASVQEVGASGGYYVACAADEIIAQPTSVVGSIGVIFQTFNVSGTMAKVGMSAEAIKSGINKDSGSPLRAMSADERKLFQEMIDSYYGRFVATVQARSQKVPADKTATAFDGRVFTGEQALALSLINRTGGLREALQRAREVSKSPRASAVRYLLPMDTAGSIYATTPSPRPDARSWFLTVPGMNDLPPGFYYIWRP
jgi:protease IV